MGSDAHGQTPASDTAPAAPQSTGLGLEDFLQPSAADTPAPETNASPEAPVETQAPSRGRDSQGRYTIGPDLGTNGKDKAETAAAKSDAPPSSEATIEKPPAAGEAAQAPKADWESADNPYRRQYVDTRNWATQQRQENIALKRQLDIINKKIDGTYDAATDEAAVQPPSSEQIQAHGELTGRVQASIVAAQLQYGEAEVDRLLFAEGAPYRVLEENDPAIKARVLASPTPALEALRVLREREFTGKYGAEPEAIKKAIRAEVEAEFTTALDAKVETKLKERLKLAQDGVTSLGEARGSSGGTAEQKTPGHRSLSEIGNPGLA